MLLGVREVDEPDLVLVAIHGVKEAIEVMDNAEEVVRASVLVPKYDVKQKPWSS